MIDMDLPRGEFTRALDTAVRNEHSRHVELLHEAEETVPCPTCRRKGDTECGTCFGTTLIPATRDEYERFELGEVLKDIKELGLDRLAPVKRWEREWVQLLSAWTQVSKALTAANGRKVSRG